MMETPTYPGFVPPQEKVVGMERPKSDNGYQGDDASSVGGDSSVAGSMRNVTRGEAENDLRKLLGRNEGRLFSSLRISFLVVLALSTAAVAFLVYKFLSDDEEESFKADFSSNAQKIIEAFHESIEEKLIAIDALATL